MPKDEPADTSGRKVPNVPTGVPNVFTGILNNY
jgi:hypothetical protein